MTSGINNQQDAEIAYLDSLLSVVEPEVQAAPMEKDPDNMRAHQPVRPAEPAIEYHPVNIPVVPFVCQTIVLSGIQFALPLSSFIRAIPWPKELDAGDVHVGCILGQLQQTKIVDLACLILPGEQTANAASDHDCSSVLVLQDDYWGLACHEVKDVIMVKPESVNWRSEYSKRQWLAGTVRDQGYAILDIDGILRLLEQLEQNNE